MGAGEDQALQTKGLVVAQVEAPYSAGVGKVQVRYPAVRLLALLAVTTEVVVQVVLRVFQYPALTAPQVQVGLLLLKNFTDLRIQNAKHILS
jgi:hypothetical protein